MAQITTITNPLTGQPAQVDQLEHTAQQIDDSIGRALPGGEIDTLLAGKAPAGYSEGRKQDGQKLKTALPATIGWYRVVIGKYRSAGIFTIQHHYGSGGPSSLKFLVTFLGGECASLKCLEYGGNKGANPQITNARLVWNKNDDTFCIDVFYNIAYKHDVVIDFINTGSQEASIQAPVFISADNTLPDGEELLAPMEWLNPPMKLGVEYRTTERYMGKPVYVKLVDFGALPNATTKSVKFSIGNNNQLLECKGFISGGSVLPYSFPGSSVGTANVYTNKSSGNFGVFVSTDKDMSGSIAYFILKYTKTTD